VELKSENVVDLYGQKGFDVIAITDHIFDNYYLRKLKERGTKIPSILPENFREYIRLLQEEQYRAWKEYGMLLIPGFEITNNTNRYHMIANQVDLFNSVATKRCRFVANSDFHHINHFYSWRTMLKTEKDIEAVKEAIKTNEDIAIIFLKPGVEPKKFKEKFERNYIS